MELLMSTMHLLPMRRAITPIAGVVTSGAALPMMWILFLLAVVP